MDIANGRGLEPPEPGNLGREAQVLLEVPRLLLRLPGLRRQPRAAGDPVLVVPGFGASDASLWALRRYLGSLGYRVRGWGLGRNNGNVPDLIPRVVERTAALAERTGASVNLVGWSLGGTLSREVARERPDLVRQVITLGTPVIGGPRYTVAAGYYERQGYDLGEIESYVDERNRTPIEVPITAIYSRRDAIVAWGACIDRLSADVEHIEVKTSHLGLTLSPEVYRLVAERLAAASAARAAPMRQAV